MTRRRRLGTGKLNRGIGIPYLADGPIKLKPLTIEALTQDPVPSREKLLDPYWRTKRFFGAAPVWMDGADGKPASRQNQAPLYQMGAYLAPWRYVYPRYSIPKQIVRAGRGTGKSEIFQGLCAADLAVFMPYFLQAIFGARRPVPIQIIFVANVKKNAEKNLDRAKIYIEQADAWLGVIDKEMWSRTSVVLKNGASLKCEGANNRARGDHGKPITIYTDNPLPPRFVTPVIYFYDEFAFWGGQQTHCFDGSKFATEIADHVLGSQQYAFTTPYGQRGGAWWAHRHPEWRSLQFPSWANPYQDKARLARQKILLYKSGRSLVWKQEIVAEFVDDSGLFFPGEIWLRAVNPELDFWYPAEYGQALKVVDSLPGRRPGVFVIGIDPNSGARKAGNDPCAIVMAERYGQTQGRKFAVRFAAQYHGLTHGEIAELVAALCAKHGVEKVNIEGGGGYGKNIETLLRARDVRAIRQIPGSDDAIKEYMGNLRALMEDGHIEMPEAEILNVARLSMRSVGERFNPETEEMDLSGAQLSATNKKSGIPCILAAMGVAIAREHVRTGNRGVSGEVLRPKVSLPEPILVGAHESEMAGIYGSALSVGL